MHLILRDAVLDVLEIQSVVMLNKVPNVPVPVLLKRMNDAEEIGRAHV